MSKILKKLRSLDKYNQNICTTLFREKIPIRKFKKIITDILISSSLYNTFIRIQEDCLGLYYNQWKIKLEI